MKRGVQKHLRRVLRFGQFFIQKIDNTTVCCYGVPITATEPSTTETTTELATKIESVTKKQVPASTKSETQKPTEKKKPPAQQNTPKTGKYHYPNCGTLKNANAENLTEINFDQTGNYSPCKKCNPPQA